MKVLLSNVAQVEVLNADGKSVGTGIGTCPVRLLFGEFFARNEYRTLVLHSDDGQEDIRIRKGADGVLMLEQKEPHYA